MFRITTKSLKYLMPKIIYTCQKERVEGWEGIHCNPLHSSYPLFFCTEDDFDALASHYNHKRHILHSTQDLYQVVVPETNPL